MRAIDTFVNVNMGSDERPDYLVRVAEDYFKRSEQMFKDITLDEMLGEMDRAGVEKSIISARPRNPNPRVLSFVDKRPDRFALAAYIDPNRGMLALRELEALHRNHPVAVARLVPFMTNTPPHDR